MEQLKHECGIVMIRLLKPLDYYYTKYGTWMYGLQKLYLMMEKQHNRGQEGAGVACVKLDVNPGEEYINRERSLGTGAITEVFDKIHNNYKEVAANNLENPVYAKNNLAFAGELYLGHLRYSTTGRSGIEYVHPFLRRNNWCAKSLLLCGNFNLTNVDELFANLTAMGQHPRTLADTFIMLEQMGHLLDMEVEYLYKQCKKEGLKDLEITKAIDDRMKIANLLKKCTPLWDGGYAMCGMTGSGESFCIRDPWGIRTAFYYTDQEIVVVASERPVIQTAMNVPFEKVVELERGQAIMITKAGKVKFSQILEPKQERACSFERIYFSRGSDAEIYKERKNLGRKLVEPVLKAIDHDLQHTVFSFIPNTAEVAYYGMLQGMEDYLNIEKKNEIISLRKSLNEEQLTEILSRRIRSEKVAIKDIKLRTFIAEGKTRNDMAAHVYDITYGTIEPDIDNLVVIDDSIVRGTTLKQSIIKILDRLHPKKIIVVSSSPQVRYPDCYGIDMSSMGEFIAFRAAISLLVERGMQQVIFENYTLAKEQIEAGKADLVNYVKNIYAPFTTEDISSKIAELLTPNNTHAEVQIVYQSLEGLHASCPNHHGDWYFSGDYPTIGGVKWINKAYIDYVEKNFSN